MAATINTNIASINAQRNLAMSGQSLTTTMQRLSSGLRVNSAKDDAAGLAISERMNTQVRGLTVASRNANDGISLAQTAEGALGKVGDMLQRMRELAVQASNATNSASDRAALQAEVSQLSAEIDRVAKQTNFNGQKILDGSFAGAVFQVGANSGDNVTLGSLVDTRASQISNISYGMSRIPADSSGEYINTSIADDNTYLEEYSLPAPVDYDPEDLETTAFSIIIANNSQHLGDASAEITRVYLPQLPAANSRQERLGHVVEAINNKSTDTGVTAYLTKKDGAEQYSIAILSSRLDSEGFPATATFSDNFTQAATGFDATDVNIDVADIDAPTINQQGLDDINVTTQEGAWLALKKIDSAIDQINSARATLGAMQTRFENAVNNIDIQVENLSAARGRIVDADFAVETANLSRTQILQQAGTAMVAQANQIPQSVLQLLQS